jgi:hypothetical protein
VAAPSVRNNGAAKTDRNTRSLVALEKTASTSRVLNLLAVENSHADTAEWAEAPFFKNRVLNSSIIIKHRLRADDQFLFGDFRASATKILIPFERSDLTLGGRSLFVGQRGWVELLNEACNNPPDLAYDLEVLRLIDGLPSLDPFLVRESLRRAGFAIAPCYFAISQADLERMHAYVGDAITELVEMALGGINGMAGAANLTKLVEALLSTDVDDRLEPLRITLMLEGESFREGVFSWKGFLYYKWSLSVLWPDLKKVAAEIGALQITGQRDMETAAYLDAARQRLQSAIVTQRNSIARTLKVYDDAFQALTARGEPKTFRDFLLRAPDMFISLGEKVGVISHVGSFWRYRFPPGRPLNCSVEEALDILQDFESGLGATIGAP